MRAREQNKHGSSSLWALISLFVLVLPRRGSVRTTIMIFLFVCLFVGRGPDGQALANLGLHRLLLFLKVKNIINMTNISFTFSSNSG